jgi:hypothetical protein
MARAPGLVVVPANLGASPWRGHPRTCGCNEPQTRQHQLVSRASSSPIHPRSSWMHRLKASFRYVASRRPSTAPAPMSRPESSRGWRGQPPSPRLDEFAGSSQPLSQLTTLMSTPGSGYHPSKYQASLASAWANDVSSSPPLMCARRLDSAAPAAIDRGSTAFCADCSHRRQHVMRDATNG